MPENTDTPENLAPPSSRSPSTLCCAPLRVEGILVPANHSFAAINEFVHDCEVSYEELQWAMLGMATDREKLIAALKECEAAFDLTLPLLEGTNYDFPGLSARSGLRISRKALNEAAPGWDAPQPPDPDDGEE